MTSVLNSGVMRGNPVGNQLRFLQNQIDVERKNTQMLLVAMETKAPEVFSEYMRLKDSAAEQQQQQQDNQMQNQSVIYQPTGQQRFQQQQQQQPQQQSVNRGQNGRF